MPRAGLAHVLVLRPQRRRAVRALLGLGLLAAWGCGEPAVQMPAEVVTTAGRLTLCEHWRDGAAAAPVGSPLVQQLAERCAATRMQLGDLRRRYAARPELLEPLQPFATP